MKNILILYRELMSNHYQNKIQLPPALIKLGEKKYMKLFFDGNMWLSPISKFKKMKEGKDLIHYFCSPCKPTKVNGGRIRNLPTHAPDKWELFKVYNKREVKASAKRKRCCL